MKSEWQILVGLLVSTGLLVWLWHSIGKIRFPPPSLSVLLQQLQTWIGSAETIKHEESESHIKHLLPNLSELTIPGLRLCLLALYALAILSLIGK